MAATDISETVDRSVATWAPTTLRVVAGLLWLSNVSWKVPPDFGSLGGYVQKGIDNQVFPGSSWFFDTIIAPNVTAFGWVTLFVEVALAATLLSGRFVRIAAVVGMVQSLGIGLAVANADGEWYWSYALMILVHLAILVTATAQRPVPRRLMAGATALYGVVLMLAHTSGGFAGDGSFSLFDQKNDFPGDFGRNVFPGSIALGVVLVVVAVAAWLLADRLAGVVSIVGYVLVAVSALLLLTYDQDGLLIGLHSKASTVVVLAALGLALSAPSVGPRSSAHSDQESTGAAQRART